MNTKLEERKLHSSEQKDPGMHECAVPMRGLNIGITIGIREPGESLWINGIKQNALFLAHLFLASPHHHRVTLLNTTDIAVSKSVSWDRNIYPTISFDDGCRDLDVLIELGGQISPEQTIFLKKQGTKIVSYCCGPEYVHNMQSIIFGREMYRNLFINTEYDCLWIIPQIYEMNRAFFEVFRRCPVQEVPFVWHPMAIEGLTHGIEGQGVYQPAGGAKRVAVIEPNIDVLKFCLYPILATELAYRQNPELIQFLHVANSDRFVYADKEFAALMRHLEIVQAGKASFIGRVTTAEFLARHTDIVVSHQWGLPLNYMYLECCWQGYPLVHNARLVSDLGYYYPDNDIRMAARQINYALTQHDENAAQYILMQRDSIRRFHADNPELIGQYDTLLHGLLNQR